MRPDKGGVGAAPPRGPAAPAGDDDGPNDDVSTLTSLRERAEHGVSRHQRRIERLTGHLGKPWSLYLILGIAAVWSGYNVVAPPAGVRPFDPPPFVWLQGLVAFGALLITSTILITQHRRTVHVEQSAQLDLQVALRLRHA